jgi:hypothetical protein
MKNLRFFVVGGFDDPGFHKRVVEIVYWKVDKTWNIHGFVRL